MRKRMWVYTLSALALFYAGYSTGHTSSSETSGMGKVDKERSTERQTRPQPRATSDASQSGKLSERAAEKYARLMDLIADGKLRVSGVDFDGDTLMPGERVKDLFGLTQTEFEEMKELGRARLQTRQDREAVTAVVRSSTDGCIEFELPADPTFAGTQASEYIAELNHRFGPQVA